MMFVAKNWKSSEEQIISLIELQECASVQVGHFSNVGNVAAVVFGSGYSRKRIEIGVRRRRRRRREFTWQGALTSKLLTLVYLEKDEINLILLASCN